MVTPTTRFTDCLNVLSHRKPQVGCEGPGNVCGIFILMLQREYDLQILLKMLKTLFKKQTSELKRGQVEGSGIQKYVVVISFTKVKMIEGWVGVF